MKGPERLKKGGVHPLYWLGRMLMLLAHIATFLLMFYGMDALEEKQKNLVELTLYSFGYLAIGLNGLLLLFHAIDVWLSFLEPLAEDNRSE